MNDTDVQATNTDYKPKLHNNYKVVLQIWFVNNNVVPGSTKMMTQEHVALGKIRFCVMTIQSEGTCLLRFLRQVDFESSFQKTKNCRLIFSIFHTITPAWLNRSVRLSSAAKFKSVFAVWRWTWYRCVYTALRIITNHTRCCWAYECKDQSEAFRWVIAEMSVFFTRSLTENLYLVNSLVRNN